MLEEICSLNVGATLNGEFTGIIAFAEDLILMSPTISGLQTMIKQCISYVHMITFNASKTEFETSGASHHPNPFVYVEDSLPSNLVNKPWIPLINKQNRSFL